MLDGDEAGRQGSAAIARHLGDKMHVAAINLREGCSPINWLQEKSLNS
jgi:hypothetical protein